MTIQSDDAVRRRSPRPAARTRAPRPPRSHRRQGARCARELLACLFEVIRVQVSVAERVHEVARLESDRLRDHHREEGIACNVQGLPGHPDSRLLRCCAAPLPDRETGADKPAQSSSSSSHLTNRSAAATRLSDRSDNPVAVAALDGGRMCTHERTDAQQRQGEPLAGERHAHPGARQIERESVRVDVDLRTSLRLVAELLGMPRPRIGGAERVDQAMPRRAVRRSSEHRCGSRAATAPRPWPVWCCRAVARPARPRPPRRSGCARPPARYRCDRATRPSRGVSGCPARRSGNRPGVAREPIGRR